LFAFILRDIITNKFAATNGHYAGFPTKHGYPTISDLNQFEEREKDGMEGSGEGYIYMLKTDFI
jgi:hypothetical protein